MPRLISGARTVAGARTSASGRSLAAVLSLPGTADNTVSTPNTPSLNISGSLDLQFLIRPRTWRPNSANVLASMYAGAGQRAFQAFLLSSAQGASGHLRLALSGDGSATINANSTAPISNINNPQWLRMTWNQTTKAVQFFTAPASPTPPSSWTQLGTDLTTNITSIFGSTEPLRIGFNLTVNEYYRGEYYRFIMKNGIDGTTVADVNFAKQTPGATSFVEDSSNAGVVTINTSGSPAATIIGRSSVV